VPELTQDMGWFGAVFSKLLVAQRAFIEELEAQVITLKHPGLIQSANFVAGNRGFQIKADGDAEFNDAVIRAHLVAKSIEAGPLSVSPSSPQTVTRNFSPNSTALDIWGSVGNLSGSWNVTGNYNGVINGIESVADKDIFPTIVQIYIRAGSIRTLIARTDISYSTSGGQLNINYMHTQRISYTLMFTISLAIKTMKLSDLPTYPNMPAESGAVYKRQSTVQGTELDYLLLVKS
jgi:hypothetical protein